MKRLNYEEVKKRVEEQGCKLLSKEYVNKRTKLELKCKCGNTFYKTIDTFKRQPHCKECGYKRISEMQKGENNTFYGKKHSKETLKVLSEFHKGKQCGSDNPMYGRRGKDSPNYNPNITDEEREKGRNIEGIQEWRKGVYKRDNYTCQKCGDNKGGNLVAHHLDGYHWDKEHRTDINNGATLCVCCHKSFHKTYGNHDNTKEQYEEWISK